jgi:hypothetical protein
MSNFLYKESPLSACGEAASAALAVGTGVRYNPLALISPQLIKAMINEPKYFVRQYYTRGQNRSGNIPLLLTYYEQANHYEANRAQFHMQQIQHDKYRFLYDSKNPQHVQRLLAAATQPQGYAVYTNLLPKAWKPPASLRNKLHLYMQHTKPWWNYKQAPQLHIHLKDRYGKLYLLLNWQNHRADVLLNDVENFKLPDANIKEDLLF